MADPTGLQESTLTFGGLLLVGGVFWSIFKGRDWLDNKIKTEALVVTDPLRIKQAALEVRAEMTEKDLNAFKVRASEIFVSAEDLARFESRLDARFAEMRGDFKELRETLMKAMSGARPPT